MTKSTRLFTILAALAALAAGAGTILALLLGGAFGAAVWAALYFFLTPLVTAGAVDPSILQSVGVGLAIQAVVWFFGIRSRLQASNRRK